jgi:hypothetical protein
MNHKATTAFAIQDDEEPTMLRHAPDHMRSTMQRRVSRALIVGAGFLLALAPLIALRPSGAIAARAAAEQASVSFSVQHRLGFQSGDDWESSLATDHFGHVYVMYKHSDVKAGQTCAGCDLHMLIQRSDDGGSTWSDPLMVAPGKILLSGKDDAQLAVDPVDGRTLYYQLAGDRNGQTQLTFGEGPSYAGPGNIWVAHSL